MQRMIVKAMLRMNDAVTPTPAMSGFGAINSVAAQSTLELEQPIATRSIDAKERRPHYMGR